MSFFQALMERIMDAFYQHPMFFLYGVISIAAVIILWFDLKRFKNNQVARQVSSRIGKTSDKKEFDITLYFSKFLAKKEGKIALDLEKANVLFTVKEYMTLLVVGGIAGFLLGSVAFPLGTIWKSAVSFLPFDMTREVVGRLAAGTILGFAGSYSPKLYLVYLIDRRKKLLSNQIQDALLSLADALHSGHVVSGAIKIVGMESPYPIGMEFARVAREMEAGKTQDAALNGLKNRIDLSDFTMAVNAISIQDEAGGKLEPLLRSIVHVIKERQELKREIEKTISSSKMIGIILLCAPIFFGVVFTMMNKEQYDVMFEVWQGQLLIVAGVLSYIIAAAIIIWIIRDVSKEV